MTIENFYKLLDKELIDIITENQELDFFKKNKITEVRKSRAFLIWFLKFYGRTLDFDNYITDGNGDSSCDIIFDAVDNMGNKIYYIIQSKWNNEANSKGTVAKADVLQALAEFDTIIRGNKKSTQNELFNTKLIELKEHIRANGEIKFVYLTLCNPNGEVDDHTNSFLSNHKKTDFEWIDIDRLRFDYINKHYKEIDITSPLNKYYNPEEDQIELKINQNAGGRSFIHLDKPFEAFVFLIKPGVIHSLFKKYGFLLFQKNVRNPLIKSSLNEQIEKTIIDNPAFFWYYNNGLTAITSLLPDFRDQADSIKITGLQIINGAQTVYSIYKAYEEASPVKREVMDSESLVTFRILKSGGKDFDLNVTRYTNSQNPVSDRDFVANEEVQLRLQKESFNTPYWYEKRRGEFRVEEIKDIDIISNEDFALYYLAYFLHQPDKFFNRKLNNKKNLIFISHRDHKNGLYESVFNDKTTFADMLAGYRLHNLIEHGLDVDFPFFGQDVIILSLFSYVFEEYFRQKHSQTLTNISTKINSLLDKKETKVLLQIAKYIQISVYNTISERKDQATTKKKKKELSPKEFEHRFKLIDSTGYYEKIKEDLLSKEFKIEDIETIFIDKEKEKLDKFENETKSRKIENERVLNKSSIVLNVSISPRNND